MTDLVALTVRHTYAASAERVFDAWLDPAIAGRFLFATPTGTMVRCDIDPRVGGRFVITDRRPDGDAEHVGEFLEIDRPRRLVFEFAVPMYSSNKGSVIVEIAPLAGGGCELSLTATTLPEYLERSVGGWTMILDGLERALA